MKEHRRKVSPILASLAKKLETTAIKLDFIERQPVQDDGVAEKIHQRKNRGGNGEN